jgi:hypothetical protein
MAVSVGSSFAQDETLAPWGPGEVAHTAALGQIGRIRRTDRFWPILRLASSCADPEATVSAAESNLQLPLHRRAADGREPAGCASVA